jgi:hypothetical protein
VPDHVRTWVPSGNLGLVRGFRIGRVPLYRNASEPLPVVCDDFSMTGQDIMDRGLARVVTPTRSGSSWYGPQACSQLISMRQSSQSRQLERDKVGFVVSFDDADAVGFHRCAARGRGRRR